MNLRQRIQCVRAAIARVFARRRGRVRAWESAALISEFPLERRLLLSGAAVDGTDAVAITTTAESESTDVNAEQSSEPFGDIAVIDANA
ncbi:MAG: LEPR-XLL domain-containing protein [Planctomycetaceae bacterium]|nr:LEPR-XLL domain-containing protein [Planctomycetaceae bacterium]